MVFFEHQALLQRLLLQRGYEVISEYVTLVRSIVAPVRDGITRRAVNLAGAGPVIDLSERLGQTRGFLVRVNGHDGSGSASAGMKPQSRSDRGQSPCRVGLRHSMEEREVHS